MLQNLDRLKVYYHVYTQGSVVGAASTLHVSQSAVSQTIQKLEREVNTPLFTRLHKKLVPTAAGERLYDILHPFMGALDGFLKDVETAKDHPTGELSIGAPPEFGKAYLPSIVADFREQYPEVTFSLEFGTPERLLPMLREGRLDFALVDLFLTRSTHTGQIDIYHFKPVVEEKVILACSNRYYERYIQGDNSFVSLSRQNFVSYRKDLQTIKQWFKHHFSKFNVLVRDVLTVDSHAAVIAAITHNVGMGIVSSHLIREKIRDGSVVHIQTSKPEITNPISIAYLQEKVPTLTEKVFEKFMVDRIRETTSLTLSK